MPAAFLVQFQNFPKNFADVYCRGIHEVNSVIILVFQLCISIDNILTLFIMTRPVHSGQVNFYLYINKLVPYQSFTCMDVQRALSFGQRGIEFRETSEVIASRLVTYLAVPTVIYLSVQTVIYFGYRCPNCNISWCTTCSISSCPN